MYCVIYDVGYCKIAVSSSGSIKDSCNKIVVVAERSVAEIVWYSIRKPNF